MPRLTRTVGLVASAALVLATAAPALASPDDDPVVADEAGTQQTEATVDASEPQASGLIITYTDGSQRVATAAREATVDEGLATETTETPLTDDTAALAFDAPASLDDAEAAATEVEKLPGVASVEPDVMVHAAAAPALNDPYWGQQWFLNGTYGTHAYDAWPSNTGRVVVGVIDTGRTAHPDLDSKTVAGRDFIASKFIARDGNGRDANPHDEGDWTTGSEGCGPASNSSWHGTHVAGIVGARANNGYGVVGNAPGVRISHLRVLGRCGGSTSDMAAAITWGSGGKVKHIPRNRKRAKVLNLSLSGRSDYCPGALQKAINGARKRGTVVVVAAGNDRRDARLYTPANCRGVVTVGSTNKYGQVGSEAPVNGVHQPYSNYGPAVDLSAPGGDLVQGDAIVSTLNAGAHTAGSPSVGQLAGTSMAAPSVAGAAALIASAGTYAPGTIEYALRWAVRPFPAGRAGYARCVTTECGRGILDVSRLVLAKKSPRITGSIRRGQSLRISFRGSWTGSPSSYSYRWLRNGKPVRGAYGLSYRISAADGGATIKAQVAGRKGPGSPFLWRSTLGKRVPKVATTTGLKIKPRKVRYGRSGAKLVAKVRVAGGRIKGKVVFRVGKKKIKAVKVRNGKAVLRLSSTRLKRGKHKITAIYVPKGPAYSRSHSRKKVLRVR